VNYIIKANARILKSSLFRLVEPIVLAGGVYVPYMITQNYPFCEVFVQSGKKMYFVVYSPHSTVYYYTENLAESEAKHGGKYQKFILPTINNYLLTILHLFSITNYFCIISKNTMKVWVLQIILISK